MALFRRRILIATLVVFAASAPLGADFTYPDFSSTANLNLRDAAFVTGNRVRLTPATMTRSGTGIFAVKQSLQSGFDTRFRFQITNPGGILDASGQPGGDGFAFIIQNVSETETGLFGPSPLWHIPYSIPNAIAVEFDTWHNSNLNDPNGNHVSVQPVGPAPDQFTEHLHDRSLGWTAAIPNMSDGNVHEARIRYRPGLLEVFVDDLSTPVLSTALDLTNVEGINRLDAAGMAWVGLGAGTGGAFENHDILSWSFTSLAAPTADAGNDQSIHAGQLVTLDGSASFDDNTPTEDLLFDWTLTNKPSGSGAMLTGAGTATPSFVADLPGTYVAALTVTDADGLSGADTVSVSSLNTAPVADAGVDQGTYVGMAVVLDGSASSDADQDPIQFSWTLEAPAGSGATLAGATTPLATLTPDLAGSYTATLTVTDLFGAVSTDSTVISVITGGQFAEEQLVAAIAIVAALPPDGVTSEGNRKKLLGLFSDAIAALQSGNLQEAIELLAQAIERTDGCVVRGTLDKSGPGRDWVTDCATQATLYASLTSALEAVAP